LRAVENGGRVAVPKASGDIRLNGHRRWLTLALLAVALPARAQTQIKPYILFQFDTSGSMAWDVCESGLPTENIYDSTSECPAADDPCTTCNAAGCGNGIADDGRLWKVKRAAADVVNSFGEGTYALARFHQEPRFFSCPGGGWTGSCFMAGADILVPFAEDNQQEILDWVDGCDNWPTHDDCSSTTNLAPAVGCSLCADCGGGCDKELRPEGLTPIHDALTDDRTYIEGVMATDPAAGCRPYVTILLTDGGEECVARPEDAAAALCDIGVPVFAIGFATTSANLNAIAAAGCGPACNTDALGNPRCDGQPIMVDNETDMALAFANIIQGAVLKEKCNGLDDNCNGLADEDFPGLGEPCCDPCPGSIVCNAAEDGTLCGGVGPCPETCNGADDNCNGLVDEGIDPPCQYEVCDGVDNDGDGLTDEPPLPGVGQPCGVDEGECSMGITCCVDGVFGCCGSTAPTNEICDCLDNNCNGQTDEGGWQRCYGGAAGECPDPASGTCNGICQPGTQTCVTTGCPGTPGFGPCLGWLGARAEECNCLDDNCNGVTDEDSCADGAPCVDCACMRVCDPAAEFPCASGYVCRGEDPGPFYCVPDPCAGAPCGPGEKCDEQTGACVSLCADVDCGSRVCCDGFCCEDWQTCVDHDGARTCDDTSCTNRDFACPDGEVCVAHACMANPCAGVECGQARFCLDGDCHDVCPRCEPIERCVDGGCVPDPCAQIDCVGTDVVCCDGECRSDPCATLSCDPGQYCDECTATCREDTCRRVQCPEGYVCRRRECLPPASLPVTTVAASGAGGCSCALESRPAPPGWTFLGPLVVTYIVTVKGRSRARNGHRP
jgi:putative metal-binding protein